MYERYPGVVKLPYILFSKFVGLLLGNHARDDVMSSKWPIETALGVTVGYHNGVARAFTLKKYINREAFTLAGSNSY